MTRATESWQVLWGRWVALLALLALGLVSPARAGLQQRIDEAASGAVLVVDEGVYPSPITIDKPLTLKGRGSPVIDGGGQGHVIHVRAADVTIEGLEVRGSGVKLSKDHAGIFIEGSNVTVRGNRIRDSLHGIYVKKADNALIIANRVEGKTELTLPASKAPEDVLVPSGAETCQVTLGQNQRGNGIHLWNSAGNVIEGNTITDTRDGVYFSFTHRTRVARNTISQVRYGLHYMYSDDNVFEKNEFRRNAAGAAIMYSEGLFVHGNRFVNNQGHRAYGILLQSVDRTRIVDNEISGNTIGLYLENSNDNLIRNNRAGRNYIGIRFTSSSSGNRFTENRFYANLHSVELTGGVGNNEWAVEGKGNLWDGAQPDDFDGDGVGEIPHREVDVLGRHRRDFPEVALLSQSPILRVLQFVHRHVALPGVPGISDPAPLVGASASHSEARRDSSRRD